jgi:hypothetical protein
VRSLARRLALAAGGLALGLALAEGVLRVSGVRLPEFWTSDPVLGIRMIPGAAGWYLDEGRAFVRINSAGFRDDERTVAKSSGTYRVVVLGDSFTEAVQVPLKDAFPKVAERLLASCPALRGRKVEVLNLGVRGFGTVQEAELMALRGWDYAPDAVVVAIYPENDLQDNATAMDRQKGDPLLVERGGRLEWTAGGLDEAREKEARARASGRRESPLWTVELVRAALRHWLHRGFWRRGAGNDPMSKDYPSRLAYAPPQDARWRRDWRLTDEALDLLRREAAAHGARLLVMTVSSPVQVYQDAAKKEKTRRLWGVSDLRYPDERLEELGRRRGYAVLDTTQALARFVERTGRPVHGFPNSAPGVGHWNADGHRVAGELLAARLCALAAKPAAAASARRVPAPGAPPGARVCTVQDVLRRIASGPGARDGSLHLASILTPAVYRYACAGVAAGRVDACDALAGLDLRIPGARSLEWNCRMRYREAILTRALARRDPRAAAVCREFLSDVFGLDAEAPARYLCAAEISGTPSAEACRRALTSEGRAPDETRVGGCLNAMREYRGGTVDCAALSRRDYMSADQAMCRGLRAFHAAEAAGGGAKACGGDPLCAALEGAGPAACERYGDEALDAYYSQLASPSKPSLAAGPMGAPEPALADDAIPRVPRFDPLAPPARGGGAPPAADPGAYPSFRDGTLEPPALYHARRLLSTKDLGLLRAALSAAHRFADADGAYMAGYRPLAGADGAPVARLLDARALRAAPDAARPAELEYVRGRGGRLRIARLIYRARGEADRPPPALFENPSARWRFRPERLCARASGTVAAVAAPADCAGPKDDYLGTTWTLSLAAPVYDPRGLFSDATPEAALREARGGVRTFFGRPLPRKAPDAAPACVPPARARMRP